jgi:RHS repeat-associated protein
VKANSVTASYDAQDRLTRYGTTAYSHDAAGDLVDKTDSIGQRTVYQYDPLGNLLGVTLPNGTAISYLNDGSNRRVGKKINGSLAKQFLYSDRLRIVAELDSAGAVVSHFVYGANSVLAYLIKGGVNFRIVADHLGSVRLVVNATTGAIIQRMDYDSFGNVIADTNPGFQPFGFAGGLYDPDTRLLRFGARDYDAETGRWTNRDPIAFAGGATNLYRYVSNDPVNSTDHSGKNEPPSESELASFLREVIQNTENVKGRVPATEGNLAKRYVREWATETLDALRNAGEARAAGAYNKTGCGFGEIVGTLGFILQVLDVANEYKRAVQNDLGLFEEEKLEQQEARDRGVKTSISCGGPFCLPISLDSGA